MDAALIIKLTQNSSRTRGRTRQLASLGKLEEAPPSCLICLGPAERFLWEPLLRDFAGDSVGRFFLSRPFFFFFFLHWEVGSYLPGGACEILVLQPGIEPGPPALEAQSLNHWTTREFPQWATLIPTEVSTAWGLVAVMERKGDRGCVASWVWRHTHLSSYHRVPCRAR